VTERFRRTPENIEYQYTVDDLIMYVGLVDAAPHIHPLKTGRAPAGTIEYSCIENNRDVQHLVTTKPGLGDK
jgi:hypothetical protein